MRCALKRLILLSVFVSFFFFMIQLIHQGSNRDYYRLQRAKDLLKTVNSKCEAAFKNVAVRKKLSRAIALGDPDSFTAIFEKYLSSCSMQVSGALESHVGYGLIDPQLPVITRPTNRTNSTTEIPWSNHSTAKVLCPRQSPLLRGPIDVNITHGQEFRRDKRGRWMNWPPTFEEIAAKYQDLQLGGFYPGPKDCRCRGYNAIIIPYRDRESHLRYFLYFIHQLLQRQQLCYVVIVAEQDDDCIFNKGQLMNTAFEFARELMSFDCYIFHDVDVIAEDDRILYTCKDDSVMHYAPYIDKYNYEFGNGVTVGAAVGFTEEQFVNLNGYSNEYAGWGGEDDDMFYRINEKKIPIWRSEKNYTRFIMIKHGDDPGNTINEHRFQRLKQAISRQYFDGINHLDTTVSDEIRYKTHIRLKVKTYMTGLQRDLQRSDAEKKKEAESQSEPSRPVMPGDVPVVKGPGIPILLPGQIIQMNKET